MINALNLEKLINVAQSWMTISFPQASEEAALRTRRTSSSSSRLIFLWITQKRKVEFEKSKEIEVNPFGLISDPVWSKDIEVETVSGFESSICQYRPSAHSGHRLKCHKIIIIIIIITIIIIMRTSFIFFEQLIIISIFKKLPYSQEQQHQQLTWLMTWSRCTNTWGALFLALK